MKSYEALLDRVEHVGQSELCDFNETIIRVKNRMVVIFDVDDVFEEMYEDPYASDAFEVFEDAFDSDYFKCWYSIKMLLQQMNKQELMSNW